ncbi:hypothetical protein [Sagittula sp. MA-2]|jgi:hypothetical protein|uniref:hypothetical protein n=1 Tax=Sagittula sp. MA-2 TaxID=3048007 RepID=UPI0024C2C7E3|nr:hypothetical protein [Sagittula sp. MA-2]WHZ37726.1 hypothetical protein QNI11_22935 [Sagittula sp. MA-2]
MLPRTSKVLEFVITKFDVAFTMGRVFGLLPVMLMSHAMTDQAELAAQISSYQIALFISTVVLYGGPQVYLFKIGIEQRIFVYHMAISSLIAAVILTILDWFGMTDGIFLPFLFLIFFRSYYLLFASYLKFDAMRSFLLLMGAVVVLCVYAITLDYIISTVIAAPLVLWQIRDLKYNKLVYGLAAFRGYFKLLLRNFSYYYNFLLQQTYSQIVLAVYALLESGMMYLQVAHAVYIYSISFIFHGVLFRLTLANMGRTREVESTRRHLFENFRISMLVGLGAAAMVVAFFRPIERVLFGESLLDQTTAAMVALMIILNSSNFGWAALLTSQRRPYTLALIGSLATGFVVAGIFLQEFLALRNGVFFVMILGLVIQAVARAALGRRVLKDISKLR